MSTSAQPRPHGCLLALLALLAALLPATPAAAQLSAGRIVGTVTGLDYDAADALLARSGWNVKAAILMQQTGATRREALSRLRVEPRLRKLLGRR